jgi:hypothetical protein
MHGRMNGYSFLQQTIYKIIGQKVKGKADGLPKPYKKKLDGILINMAKF